MPIIQSCTTTTKHFFPDEATYIKAMERGEVKEGDEVIIEGDDIEYDDKPTEGSDNLVNSGVVFNSIKQAKEEVASEALSNIEIEEILSKFI